MAYELFIWSTAAYVESRLKSEIKYEELEQHTGFSYRHLREIFKEYTGVSLSKYILQRRIINCAFDIVHTSKKLTDIAYEYMFSSYDVFAKAFKSNLKVSPSEFRKKSYKVGRKRILMGMYAPDILKDDDSEFLNPIFLEDFNMDKTKTKTNNSCILYGVPKVEYTYEESTPFPVALKACLNYMGQKIDYTNIMAISGAAFRLRWNVDFWDGGNVDVMNIYEEEYDVFTRSFEGAGRKYNLLKRDDATKEDFISFIKDEIDNGRPVIALGIIGPPEACLVTGYRDDGNTLLGWNCFQDNKEFASDVVVDDCGYYITNNWWENEETIALMSVGEEEDKIISHKETIKNAIDILTKDTVEVKSKNGKVRDVYAGGQKAYDVWIEAIRNDKEFSDNTIIPILIERLMCQGDAQTMIGEGRYYAATYIERVGNENKIVQEMCNKAAENFKAITQCSFDMCDLRGGFMQNEETLKKFVEPEVRKATAKLIAKAKRLEYEACELLKQIYNKL